MSSNSIGILNSALQLNKSKIDLAMQNIANADNEKYSVKTIDSSSVVVANSPQGVKIDGIRNSSNELLQKNLLSVSASSKSHSYISGKCKEFTDKLALPGTNQGLFNKLSVFSDSIDTLALNPMNSSMRNDVRDKANDLSGYINGFATYLQEQRYKADDTLSSAFQYINSTISNIHQANTKQMLYSDKSIEYAQIQDEVNSELQKLSEYFDINFSKDESGILHVYLKNGGQEIVGKQRYHFEYDPAKSIDTFIQDNPLNPVYLVVTSVDGREKGKNIFINGGQTSDMSYSLSAGAIDGFLQVRDFLIPHISETIDMMAVKVATVFNEIHNKGNGSNPLSEMNGSVLCTGNDIMLGNGKIIINPMGSDGKPMVSANYGKIPALELDLNKFTTNNIGGSFTTRGLVNTINQYFQAAATSRLEIDGFHTVNLAVKNVGNSGNIELDFDLIAYDQNPAAANMDFKITGVTANGSSITLPTNSAITVNNADHIRTGINGGPSFTIPQSSGSTTLEVTIETTLDGVTKTATVEYIVNTGAFVNQTFTPISATGDANVLTGSTNSVVKASIVDSNGVEITDDNTPGVLKIENTQRNGVVAIDSANSNLASVQNSRVSGSFSGAFGLNDVFSFKNGNVNVQLLQDDNATPTKNIAVYMQLNNSIKNSVNSFAVGKMEEYRTGLSNFDSPTIFFSAGVGDTSLVSEYQKLRTKNISFNKTFDIDHQNSTIYCYAADIVSVNNIRSINNEITANRETALKEMLSIELAGETGVNVDDEAIKVMQYQKNYTIAAKFINTSNNLLQTLIDNI